MSLAALYNAPRDALELQWWSFHNAAEHMLIVNEILRQKASRIELPALDPIPVSDLKNWLRRHQEIHNAQNSALGVSGNDLTSLDLESEPQVKAWIQLHAQEHYLTNRELGL